MQVAMSLLNGNFPGCRASCISLTLIQDGLSGACGMVQNARLIIHELVCKVLEFKDWTITVDIPSSRPLLRAS